jgi:hypothetical protein
MPEPGTTQKNANTTTKNDTFICGVAFYLMKKKIYFYLYNDEKNNLDPNRS